MKNWKRIRFKTKSRDWRPVTWPPYGSYWCSGETVDASIMIAYVKSEEQLFEQWPEAEDLEIEDNAELAFSDRFPKPDYEWKEK